MMRSCIHGASGPSGGGKNVWHTPTKDSMQTKQLIIDNWYRDFNVELRLSITLTYARITQPIQPVIMPSDDEPDRYVWKFNTLNIFTWSWETIMEAKVEFYWFQMQVAVSGVSQPHCHQFFQPKCHKRNRCENHFPQLINRWQNMGSRWVKLILASNDNIQTGVAYLAPPIIMLNWSDPTMYQYWSRQPWGFRAVRVWLGKIHLGWIVPCHVCGVTTTRHRYNFLDWISEICYAQPSERYVSWGKPVSEVVRSNT